MARKIETSTRRNPMSVKQAKRKRGRSVMANMAIGFGLTVAALFGASVVTVATTVKPTRDVQFQTALLKPIQTRDHFEVAAIDRSLDVSKFSRLPGSASAHPKGGRLAGAEVAALEAMRPEATAVRQALHHAMNKAARHSEREEQFAALSNRRPGNDAIRAILQPAMQDLVVVAPRGESVMPDLIQDAETVADVAQLKDMKPVEMAALEDVDGQETAELTQEVALAPSVADAYALPSSGPMPVLRPAAGTRGDDAKPADRGNALAAIASVAPQKPGRSNDDDKPTALAFAKPNNPMREEPAAPAPGAPNWPGIGSKVAIYDITNGVVHMPDGTKLEAHSGIGEMRDNPKYTHVKMRGPTPPGTYKLSMREKLFHGVAAIRLTSVDGKHPQNRTGLLAHSYLLRVKGDSHGCVAFAQYDKFLKAFQRGQITHMVIVPKWDGRRPGGSGGGLLAKLFKNDA